MLKFDLEKMFTNSEEKNCPITGFSARSERDGPLLNSKSIKVTGSTLTIDQNVETTLEFFLEAKTESGVTASQPFDVLIKNKAINNLPYFKPKLQSSFKVELVRGKDGNIEDTSIV